MPSCLMLIPAVIGLSLAMSTGMPARAEVVPVVSAKSPAPALARQELADIFLGRKMRFPDGRPVVPLDQQVGSPLREEFYDNVVGISAVQLKAHWSKIIFTGRGKPPRAMANDLEVRRAVASDPQYIGYIDRSLVDDSVRVLSIQQSHSQAQRIEQTRD
ncbi:MAG: phosphate ABC transporter substrate-binding protein [Pseudomonadota bacterium]|nr:phosphate ABC transporter substrate-binding protein [Pseudomonadota bacterium]